MPLFRRKTKAAPEPATMEPCADVVPVRTNAVQFLSDAEFEDAFADAFETLPKDLERRIDNVHFVISDEPTLEQRGSLPSSMELLGLYVGIPLPARSGGYTGALPDTIFLFAGPIQRISGNRDATIEQIRKTLLHEIGHFFGMTDARLRELSY